MIEDVFEVDVGGLAAQLYGRGNDVLGGTLQNVRTHWSGTGEGDLGDALAGSQRLTGFGTKAVDDVQHTRRQQVLNGFHQLQNGPGGLLGRLEDDAVACRQGRCNFPRRHQQREVPGNDLADNTQRFMEVVGHGVFVDLADGAFLRTNTTGKVAEVVDGQWYVSSQSFAYGLAVVPGFGHGDLLQICFQTIGNFEQQIGALLHGRAAPGILGCMGSIQCKINVFSGGAGNFAEGLTGHRRNVFEVLAFHRGFPFTADEVAVTRLYGNNGACLSWLCIDHVFGLLLLFASDLNSNNVRRFQCRRAGKYEWGQPPTRQRRITSCRPRSPVYPAARAQYPVPASPAADCRPWRR